MERHSNWDPGFNDSALRSIDSHLGRGGKDLGDSVDRSKRQEI